MALVLVVVLVLDQVTKALVDANIEQGEHRDLILGIDLVNVRNTGVAFSALRGSGALIGVIVAIALVALLVYFARHAGRRLVWLPTGLLLGGALGNALDRIRHGAVVDFIKPSFWPAFNVADSAITIGVVVLVLVLEQRDAAHRSG
jgi:signal peptidase II